MHPRNSIINLPLLVGIALSVAIHIAALCCNGFHTPPLPIQQRGKTVLRLTLAPSIAQQAEAPKPPVEKPKEQPIEELKEEPVPVPVKKIVEQPPEAPPNPEPRTDPPAEASIERDANLIEDKGVLAEAKPFKAVSPTYPRISRRRGEEGTVTLAIQVFASGKAGSISVIHSSHYKRLDEAAIRAAKKTRFVPATQFGKKVDSIMTLSYTFLLRIDS